MIIAQRFIDPSKDVVPVVIGFQRLAVLTGLKGVEQKWQFCLLSQKQKLFVFSDERQLYQLKKKTEEKKMKYESLRRQLVALLLADLL